MASTLRCKQHDENGVKTSFYEMNSQHISSEAYLGINFFLKIIAIFDRFF